MFDAGAVCDVMDVRRVAERVSMLNGTFSLLAILGCTPSIWLASLV